MNASTQKWSSNWLFVVAAIGSAAGLGNVWRFPYLAYEHGGGAFFVAYIVCMLALGLPLLLSEMSRGHHSEKSIPKSMEATGGMLGRFVGWCQVGWCGLFLPVYMVILGYTLLYTLHSFSMGWAGNEEHFFYNEVLQISGGITESGSAVVPLLLAVLAAYAVVFLLASGGMRFLGRALSVCVPIPFVLMLLLAVWSAFQPGALEGLLLFFVPTWQALQNAELWAQAAGQVFFSLSLGMGVAMAYGAALQKKARFIPMALAIMAGDTLMSLLGGIVIFSTLGTLAASTGAAVTDIITSGIGLAFVALPTALAGLPSVIGHVAGVAFFGSLFFLGLTSAVSLLFAVSQAVSTRFPGVPMPRLVLLLVGVMAYLSFQLMGPNGLYLIDVIDRFLGNHALLALALFEAIIFGWIFGARHIRQYIQEVSGEKLGRVFDGCLLLVAPGTLGYVWLQLLLTDTAENYGGYPSVVLRSIGVISFGALLFLASVMTLGEKKV